MDRTTENRLKRYKIHILFECGKHLHQKDHIYVWEAAQYDFLLHDVKSAVRGQLAKLRRVIGQMSCFSLAK